MEDILRQLSVILRGMWLYRWWGLAAAWIVGPIAAATVYLLPDRYESSARVYVDTQSILKPLMSGLAVQPNVDQQINILSRTLISRPNVEKLIRMADLDLTVKNKEEREALIASVTKSLEIRVAAGRDNLYTLAYTDTDAERAKRVVQSLVSMFVESGLGDKRKDSDTARKFIEEQIKAYEQKLEEAENRLKEYKLRNLNTVGTGGRDYFSKMNDAGEQLNQAKLALREAENSRDALKRQLTGEEPVLLPENPSSATLATVSVPELDGRIEALKKSLDGLLQRFTDQHPDVVGARKQIESLEAQKIQEIKARRKAAPSGGTAMGSANANPVFQQLKMSLAEAEANVASLHARVAEYESRVQSLNASSRMLPQIEAEFTQLNRDYDVNKRNYDALVARRESATMAVEMGATSGVADFRLIDPPTVPSKPAAPNRLLLMPGAGLAALLLGAAISFLISQIRPTFSDTQVLREVTGLAVLGSVSMLADPDRLRNLRRGKIVFLGGVGALVGLFSAMTVWLMLARMA